MHRRQIIAVVATVILALTVGCTQHRANTPSEKKAVADALDQAGYRNIRLSEDRNKGVITLKGDITSQAGKEHAEQIARQAASNSVIANELLVTGDDKGTAKEVAHNNDDAIKARFKEWTAANHLKNQHVSADVNNGVVTLTGNVATQAQRTSFEKQIAQFEGVTEVVNKLDVKPSRRSRSAPVNSYTNK